MGAVTTHLIIPSLQVIVCHFPRGVKHHDSSVGTIVVRGMQFVEGLLTSCVPDVYLNLFSFEFRLMPIHGQCVSGTSSFLVVIE